MPLKDLPRELLDEGRDRPFARQFRKELKERRDGFADQLVLQAIDQPVDNLRVLAARIAEIEWVLKLFDTRGA